MDAFVSLIFFFFLCREIHAVRAVQAQLSCSGYLEALAAAQHPHGTLSLLGGGHWAAS